jgi:hypothetical protein
MIYLIISRFLTTFWNAYESITKQCPIFLLVVANCVIQLVAQLCLQVVQNYKLQK